MYSTYKEFGKLGAGFWLNVYCYLDIGLFRLGVELDWTSEPWITGAVYIGPVGFGAQSHWRTFGYVNMEEPHDS